MLKKITQIKGYLESIYSGQMRPNNQILNNIQEILNFLPDLNSEHMMKAFSAKNNDNMFILYICSLTRSLISLHTLINNKIENRELEKKEEFDKQEKAKENSEKEKEKEKSEKDKNKEENKSASPKKENK